MEEKRRYMRFNVLLDALCRTGGALRKLKINNFSREGLGILSEEPIHGGKNVDIELMIPGDNVPIVITGQITWLSEPEDNDALRKGGVRLKKMSKSDRGRILNHIYRKWMVPKTEQQKKRMEGE